MIAERQSVPQTLRPDPIRGTPGARVVLNRDQLIRLSTGCRLMLWSFPLGIGAVAAMLRTDLLRVLHLPLLAAAILICGWGAFVYHSTRPAHDVWHHRTSQSLLLITLALYFSPFLYWWTRNPGSYYFAINSLLFAMCISVFLLHMNTCSGFVAETLGDKLFLLETRLCGWIILLLVAAYFTYTLIYLLIYQFTRGGTMFPYNIMRSGWVIMLVPFALTMGSLWKTRSHCLRALVNE